MELWRLRCGEIWGSGGYGEEKYLALEVMVRRNGKYRALEVKVMRNMGLWRLW